MLASPDEGAFSVHLVIFDSEPGAGRGVGSGTTMGVYASTWEEFYGAAVKLLRTAPMKVCSWVLPFFWRRGGRVVGGGGGG